MNFLCSHAWLTEKSGVDAAAPSLAATISLYGPSVERSHSFTDKFEHMVIGKVVEVTAHPNAQKLKKCKVSIGKKDVVIVCGGSNVVEGMLAIVALPGATVLWHGQGEPVVLAEAEIRGEKSFGMMCGADEIGLSSLFTHAEGEIVDMSFLSVKPGTSLAEALHLVDTVYDIEVTTNRVDMMCVEGIARETAAIYKKPYVTTEPPAIVSGSEKISVVNKEPTLCTRYSAVAMEVTTIAQSPLWMRSRLMSMGISPVNTIVDIGNYVMLEMGQPLHAFDADTMQEIIIRTAKKGEKMLGLDGVTYEFEGGEVVIANKHEIGALAGIMGSRATGITLQTKKIIWEAATFDGVSIRKTARAHTVYSESQARFEKQLPTALTKRALARAVALTQELVGGTVVSTVVDEDDVYVPRVIMVAVADIEKVLGVSFDVEAMRESLTTLGFEITGEAVWEVRVPFWRTIDVTVAEDIIEEVARLVGYHTIPGELPQGVSLAPQNHVYAIEQKIARVLSPLGINEQLSYSMVSQKELDICGIDTSACVTIANPLSHDGVFMRPRLLPSLLTSLERNQTMDAVRLYELAPVYHEQKGLPKEERMLGVVILDKQQDQTFFEAKHIVEVIGVSLHLPFSFVIPKQVDTLFHGGRVAQVLCEGVVVGTVGEVHPLVLQRAGIEHRVTYIELSVTALSHATTIPVRFTPIPSFPGVKRDVAFLVNTHETFEKMSTVIRGVDERVVQVEQFDEYQGKGVPEGKKSVAFHVMYQDVTKTLTTDEADALHAQLFTALETQLQAVIRK